MDIAVIEVAAVVNADDITAIGVQEPKSKKLAMLFGC